MITNNEQGAAEFAKKLASGGPGGAPMIDPNVVFEIFMGANRVQETTAFLLEALKVCVLCYTMLVVAAMYRSHCC
jgi:clathrin heavy chain